MNFDSVDEPGAWSVKALHTSAESPAIPIPADGLAIGRAESNDLVLPSEEFPGVSSTHLRVAVRDGELFVEDLGSKNGTFVGGAPITRTRLDHGDVFELGRGGPRFVVLSPTLTAQTVLVDRYGGGDTGAEPTVVRVPAHTKMTEVVTRANRRNTYLLVVVLLVLLGGGVWAGLAFQETGDNISRLQRRIDDQLLTASDRIDRHRESWEERVRKMETRYDTANRQNRDALEKERNRLRAELATRGSAEELQRLRVLLNEANANIARLDPVSMEESRVAKINEVGRAVVLVEVHQTFVEPKTRRQLYLDKRSDGAMHPNLDQKGKLYVQDSTGSGFCISEDGWILTNAHVVLKKEAKQTLHLGPDLVLHSEALVQVVFSNTDRRIVAELKDWVSEGPQDLALLQIEPFADMPHLDGIDTTRPRPEFGRPVYLLGFPLGKRALQQGETVIASAFRGIVSRQVDMFLQVDAAVHRGNSGGPVITEAGQVIGVVVGMQRISDDEAASDMGYIIPIDRATDIWPYRPGRKRN